jgi:hypothetical protein
MLPGKIDVLLSEAHRQKTFQNIENYAKKRAELSLHHFRGKVASWKNSAMV